MIVIKIIVIIIIIMKLKTIIKVINLKRVMIKRILKKLQS